MKKITVGDVANIPKIKGYDPYSDIYFNKIREGRDSAIHEISLVDIDLNKLKGMADVEKLTTVICKFVDNPDDEIPSLTISDCRMFAQEIINNLNKWITKD